MNKKSLPYIIIGLVLIVGIFYTLTSSKGFSSITQNTALASESQVVELKNGDTYNLTASIVKKQIAGAEVKMLAYNGSIPGPIIKVAQGSEVTIHFKNETDVPTTLHSHGVRLSNTFDGVPSTTEEEIQPGESFSYKIKFPDAGMFWYHPHVREDYAQELGLYGSYLVTSTDTNYWSPVNREVPLFLDDILIENGKVAPFDIQKADHTLMGRYGNVFLVNGSDAYSLQAKKGEVIRFYVANSANVRPFNFTIVGAKMKLVGGDSGAYEKDRWVDALTLGPSERAVVEVLFDTVGTFVVQNKTPDKTDQLGIIVVSNDTASPSYASTFSTLKTHDDVVKSIDPFRSSFSKQLDKQLKLTVDLKGAMGGMNMGSMNRGGGNMMPNGTMMGVSKDGIEWNDTGMMSTMNQTSNTDTVLWKIVDVTTGKENMNIDWNFKVGDKVKIRITNNSNSSHPMQHPIHFHGQRFLVLNRNSVEQTDFVWKDTVLVPSGQYVDILLDASNPGTWMAHCHIAEHLESGMMFSFNVE
ncbi:MAG: multicopper oxidase family protein [Patescibacteria group bacterium]